MLRAEYLHHVWVIDFQFDQTIDVSTLKFLNVIDEYSRFALTIRAGMRCSAVDVIDMIEELLKFYPVPIHLQMFSGPEFFAYPQQECCVRSGYNMAYILLCPPWENPFVESFISRFRDELLNIELFTSVHEVKLLA